MKSNNNTKTLDVQQGAFKYFGNANSDGSGSLGWAPRYKNVTQLKKFAQIQVDFPDLSYRSSANWVIYNM